MPTVNVTGPGEIPEIAYAPDASVVAERVVPVLSAA
jgi:hypothetical protein